MTKKRRQSAPTIKQERAARILQTKILENIGDSEKKISKGEVLKEAGYKKSIQQNPDLVLKSKGFLQKMNEMGFKDEQLLLIHNELLSSEKDSIRLEALKEAYKLKDKYPSQKIKLGKLDEIEKVFTEVDIKEPETTKETNE